MVEEGSTTLVVKQEVQTGLALERVVQLQNEGMIQRHEYLPLQLNVTEVVLLLQNRLIKNFHGIIRAFARLLLLLDEEDFREATLSQQADHSNRAQVHLIAKVLRGVRPTRLHHIVIERDALFHGMKLVEFTRHGGNR